MMIFYVKDRTNFGSRSSQNQGTIQTGISAQIRHKMQLLQSRETPQILSPRHMYVERPIPLYIHLQVKGAII